MTAKFVSGTEVNRPEPGALNSTVLDHATVVENASTFGYRNNAGLWPSYNCLDTLVPTPICPDPLLSEIGGFKTFATAPWVPGFEFAVHGGVQCLAVGLDEADQKSEIERVFSRNEGKGVEMALLLNRFVATGDPGSGEPVVGPYAAEWDAPVDLSGVGMTLLGALAALEGYAASVYAGVPTIHMPRAAAVVLFALGALIETDGKFFTKTGAKVAAGGGYDSAEVPDGTYDLYATGEVYVERSDEFSHQAHVLPGDGSGTGSDENGLSDNTVLTLVERMFRVGIDCFVAKATGRVWGA